MSGHNDSCDNNFMSLVQTDYIPNEDHIYVFTSETRELPIATQLNQDRSGEGIESFVIHLLPPQTMAAEIVFPSCVGVTIIDDDCKHLS